MLNLLVLKNNFNDIKNLRESSINLMRSLGEKVETLKIIYNELIANNLNETDTGLDSLHFQTKLINLELDNYQKTFKIIDNRVYGDYYKLFKKLTKYLNENIKNKNITIQFDNKEYQVYKDLNNIQDYDFGSTTEIYNDIIQIIDILQNELLEREHKLEMQKIKQKSGLYIDTLISKVNYNNNYLRNHIELFNENAQTFNNFHKKYLTRFLLKTKLFYGQINNDIKLEESKNSIDYKLEDNQSIILEEDEENEIRNLINTTDNSGKDIHVDTKNNVINELNSIISGLNDSTSNSSPEKLERDSIVSGISTPISEPEVRNKNEIIKLEKDIDKIMEDENDEPRENDIHRIEMKQNLLTYKCDNDDDLDNDYETRSYYKYCAIM